jgi:16S rRNA (uracil1498-N3)-methyltransferase
VSVPRFLVGPTDLAGTSTILTGPELRHLRVRRLRVGSTVVLANGAGQQREGIVVAVDRHQAVIRLTDRMTRDHESTLQLVLAQALLKADKLDFVIAKATELGVSEIMIFECQRSARRNISDRRARWARIAQSAAKQSQRSTVPVLIGPLTFDDLLEAHPRALRLFLWEEHPAGGWDVPAAGRDAAPAIVVTVGPEGGFSPTEAERAAAAGMRLVGLAPRILRAETAAIVAVTLCQFLWGDLVQSQPTAAESRSPGHL